jgi:hypothetical protein
VKQSGETRGTARSEKMEVSDRAASHVDQGGGRSGALLTAH